MTSNPEMLDEWVASGAFRIVNNEIIPTDEFLSDLDKKRQNELSENNIHGEEIPQVVQEAELGPVLNATYATLCDWNTDASPGQVLVTAILLATDEEDLAELDGTPDGFVPLCWEEADTLVSLCDRCIVYIWRDDCPSCETMKDNLSEIFGQDAPEDVLALSIYGPNNVAKLQEEYDVSVGPTTLFTLNGSIDSRFVGAADSSAIEDEIDVLQKRLVPQ